MLQITSAEFGVVVFPDDAPEQRVPMAVYVSGSNKRALALIGRRLVRVSQDDQGVYRDWKIGDGVHQEDQRDADVIAMLALLHALRER